MGYEEFDQQILDTLWREAGMRVSDIAERVPKRASSLTNQQHSAQIWHRLMELQKSGRVCPIDDQKPVAWIKAR